MKRKLKCLLSQSSKSKKPLSLRLLRKKFNNKRNKRKKSKKSKLLKRL